MSVCVSVSPGLVGILGTGLLAGFGLDSPV